MSEKAPAPKRIQAAEGQIKKPPLWKRVKGEFFAGTFTSVGEYLWKQVMKPALLKLLDDAGSNALHYGIYGTPKANTTTLSHVSQSSIYAGRNATQFKRNNYNNIMADCPPCDRELIENILTEIMKQLTDYKQLSVNTLSQILPAELSFPVTHIDIKWGWKELNPAACIVEVPGGYVLSLPPARQLMD